MLFWRDTNIGNGGDIFYRETNESDTLLSALQLLPTKPGFIPTSAFIATWNEVSQTRLFTTTSNDTNTYQAVLMTDGWRSFVALLYTNIEWGPRAQIGFNAGDGNRSFTVPGGLTPATLYMQSMSNVGQPGLFIYQVDGELLIIMLWVYIMT